MTTQLKVVRATYYPPTSVFKIPKSIDIEDKSVVKGYWVRYNELCIVFVDPSKDMLCIQPYIDACQSEDYKDPMTIEVVDADEEGISDDEEDEEEDEPSVCEECEKPKVNIEDKLCHCCYHKTCDEGECYCVNKK